MPFTTVYIFQPKSFRQKYWAFTQMGLAHSILQKVAGQSFYKLLGSGGGNGFGLWPDWGTYVLLQSWESEQAFLQFEKENAWLQQYKTHAPEVAFLKLTAYKAHGTWNNKVPFTEQENTQSKFIAVLTRASIKPKLMHKFWRFVPSVSKKLFDFDGLVFAKGVGELPLVEQATLSVWKSAEMMQSFAYKDKRHAEVVKKTRELDWYSEELFARFNVLEMKGSYKGRELRDSSA